VQEQTYISSYIHISKQTVFLNGNVVFESTDSGADFLISAYKHFAIDYPKFYKMDNLSKLAFLAAESLLRGSNLKASYKPEDIAIVLSNANSSLDTDIRYWDSVATAASPSLFVYTLPNVMIGEICIRHHIKGENTCFVRDKFDVDFQTNYVNGLLNGGNAEVCISGWADYLYGKMEAFFMLVEKKHTSLAAHDPLTVKKLYHRQWKN
jgi:hypothetical protein